MFTRLFAVCALGVVASSPANAGDDPFADAFLSYEAGLNPVPGYIDPATALGSPERFTGEGVFPGVVSCFNPPFVNTELVSVGAEGHLAVSFETPVTDDPGNPFGIDLLIFGNAFLLDTSYPAGVAGGLLSDLGGVVAVSADGVNWITVAGVTADDLFPTLGYLDSGPYDVTPGADPSDFTRPVDPALVTADFTGLDMESIRALYDGSGGGVGVDLAGTGLDAICCVRITNPGDPGRTPSIEIDAFSDVAAAEVSADLDGDGVVGVTDLLQMLGAWGPCPDPPDPCVEDLDGDDFVGVVDLLMLLGHWTV